MAALDPAASTEGGGRKRKVGEIGRGGGGKDETETKQEEAEDGVKGEAVDNEYDDESGAGSILHINALRHHF